MCCARIAFVLLLTSFFLVQSQCKSIKKNQNDLITPISNALSPTDTTEKPTKSKNKSTSPPPAIIAIEIVDPNENSTGKSKNSKRTIGSQLGYGYQDNNYFGVSNKPKLVYYKYSQQNIPSYQENSYYNGGGDQGPGAHIQKSVEYDLGKTVQYTGGAGGSQQNLVQYYQPGTTLFTTFGQGGQVNQLTSQAPQQGIPVVYLKIYSDQLGNTALYPNLPDSHPYSHINGINLQALLSNYLQGAYVTTGQNVQQAYPQQTQQLYQVPQQQAQNCYLPHPVVYHQNYQDQINQYQYQQYQQPQQVAQVYHQQNTADDLPTHENYPDDAHTRVIFHSDNGGHFPEQPQPIQPNVVPSVTTYETPSSSSSSASSGHVPPAQSYSSIEFKPSQPDYAHDQQQGQQEQNPEGYYYYKPTNTNYYAQNGLQGYQSQYDEEASQVSQASQGSQAAQVPQAPSAPVQSDDAPYNYHAHDGNSKKRNVRRPDFADYKIAEIMRDA